MIGSSLAMETRFQIRLPVYSICRYIATKRGSQGESDIGGNPSVVQTYKMVSEYGAAEVEFLPGMEACNWSLMIL